MGNWAAEVSSSWAIAVRNNVSKARGIRVRVSLRAVIWFHLAFLVTIILAFELASSWIEARLFTAVDQRLAYSLKAGSSPTTEQPASGPYDRQLGFYQLSEFTRRLESNQFAIKAQARASATARALSRFGIFPIYHEKNQAGLKIEGWQDQTLLDNRYPAQVYPGFHEIPPLVVNTLLFIENRQLRNDAFPDRNPAIEWGRTGRAVVGLAIHTVYRKYPRIGGSTLATQLEKMRHSDGGQTQSVTDKARQMVSASLRAYMDGSDTRSAEERIVCDYVNSIPLSATPAQGEIIGLADGMKAWYGADFDTFNRLLSSREDHLNAKQMATLGATYREVLSLFLAMRAPTWYLVQDSAALAHQTDRYLRVLAANGIISPRLRDAALRAHIQPKPSATAPQDPNFVADKAPNAIRMELLPLLGLDNTYALDRLDLTVKTTLDKSAQDSITRFLLSLSNPSRVAAAGMDQHQLLDRGNPGSVIYSVTLYEHTGGANLLRVQTDNFNQPLDINQGTKLQLGSTAKLRTLINYLQIIQQLHDQYGDMTDEQLRQVLILPGDRLTTWAIDYLSTTYDRSLKDMLEAALQRKYSGNPGEAFFTAGGVQSFANFERSEDYEFFTVSEGFQKSVNLVFVRLLRDIENYYKYRVPGASPTVLTDPNDPARQRYLARFADMEGRVFLRNFYEKYRAEKPDQALQSLVSSIRLTPVRAAVIYRSVHPEAGMDSFREFLKANLTAYSFAHVNVAELYSKYGPDKFNLQDRGYLARVHPLELWLLSYRAQHPQATLAQIFAASAKQRQEVYQWLFTLRYKQGQNSRIATMLEVDAFKQIHSAWQKLGYPFDSLVPSYATAIGVSGDTPAALAKLVGIILNNGVLYPTESIEQLHFGAGTPFETILARQLPPGRRLLIPVIAQLVRQEMIGVVQNGTGRRLQGGIKMPNGAVIPVGGKTGTGDNEFRVYGTHGGLVGSRVVNRTAAFTFFIGNRYFGTVLAFVPGKSADDYGFTSALAVQVLKDLTPELLPLVKRTEANPSTSTPVVSFSPQSQPHDTPPPADATARLFVRASPRKTEQAPPNPQLGSVEAMAAEWRFPAASGVFRYAVTERVHWRALAARNRANDQQRLAPRRNRFRQFHIRSLV